VSKPHDHRWRSVGHLDGCHAYSWAYSCLCGASRSTGAERDFKGEEGMSMVWVEESCERCQELLDGAEPKDWDEITEAWPQGKSA
jgi:hypothetical protein